MKKATLTNIPAINAKGMATISVIIKAGIMACKTGVPTPKTKTNKQMIQTTNNIIHLVLSVSSSVV